MALIDNYINVNITKGTLGVTTSSLNTLMIIGDTKKTVIDLNILPRVKSYASLAEVLVDYNDTTSPEYRLAVGYFAQDPKPSKLLIGRVVDTETFASAYPLIALEDNSFYGLAITDRTIAVQKLIAALAQANNKLFGVSDGVLAIVNNSANNLAAEMKTGNYSRTFVTYIKSMADGVVPKGYAEGAIFGRMFSQDAGSITWAFKNVATLTSDKLSETNIANLKINNCNFYTPFAGTDVLLNGTTATGDFIDIIHGGDWLAANIQAKIASCFLNTGKIPYTNAGINIIESMLRLALNEGVARKIIDEQSIVITVPTAEAASQADRVARTLNVSFEARFQGAIHIVGIKGTISI